MGHDHGYLNQTNYDVLLGIQDTDVLAVSGDHSTPSILAAHGWQPVPALVASRYCGADQVSRFTERDCASGALGVLPAQELMPILMANALRFIKYGA